MTLLPILSDAEMAAFEDECFRNWLNRIDARVDYDVRRKAASVDKWRALFDAGECENGAIAVLVW
jgi:hypothetical protein